MPLSRPTNSRNVSLRPRFFASGYEAAMVDLMSAAMDQAWADFEPLPKNENLAMSLIASAITEAIVANVREHDVLVRKATVTLIAAIKLDPEALSCARFHHS